jgi:hypothetical protein
MFETISRNYVQLVSRVVYLHASRNLGSLAYGMCWLQIVLTSFYCSFFRQVHDIHDLHFALSSVLCISAYDPSVNSSIVPILGRPFGFLPTILPSITILIHWVVIDKVHSLSYKYYSPGFSVHSLSKKRFFCERALAVGEIPLIHEPCL